MIERKEKFTLGEWVFDPYTGFVDSLVSEDEEGANYESVCEVSGAIGDPNGYLIAAAPEMYAIVSTLEKWHIADDAKEEDVEMLLRKAAKVAKKARGEE